MVTDKHRNAAQTLADLYGHKVYICKQKGRKGIQFKFNEDACGEDVTVLAIVTNTEEPSHV